MMDGLGGEMRRWVDDMIYGEGGPMINYSTWLAGSLWAAVLRTGERGLER